MRTKVAAATVLLSLGISASAQITKNQKYDWGWSYKLEMPETGLKCEFPEKPTVTTLAYGYMTAAAYKDELYIAAKLENPNPLDIKNKTQQFANELRKLNGLPIQDVKFGNIVAENGNLTVSGNAKSAYADFHIDAFASEDVLTVFIYAHHNELSVPGHFFASSYSAADMKTGALQSSASNNKQVEKVNLRSNNAGSNAVRLKNSPVTVEWPALPSLEVNRHEAEYQLVKNGTHYAVRVMEVGPQISYAFFNTLVSKEQLELAANKQIELVDDETEVAFQLGNDNEAFFRKISYRTANGTGYRFYVAAQNKIYVQEMETSHAPSTADTRFVNTFEQSVRNEFDTRTFVSR